MYAGVELFKFNTYFKNFKCQGGCYPWHGAPSDGHKTLDKYEKFKRVKNIIFFLQESHSCKNRKISLLLHRLHSSGREMCRNTPKIYDIKSKDIYKVCTQVDVPLLKGMYELIWMTETNSWNNNLVAALKIKIIWYVDFF